MHELGGDAHAVGLAGQSVESGGNAALQRVLDRYDRPVGVAVLDGHNRLVDGGIGTSSTSPGADARSASVKVPAGPRKATRIGGSQASAGAPAVRAMAVSTASSSSGESSCSDSPWRICFT